MLAGRAAVVALAIASVLYLMLDSGAFRPGPAPAVFSASLAILGVLFGLGAWASAVGGQRSRTPVLAGMATGVLGYAVLRLVAF